MTLSYDETLAIVNDVLKWDLKDARKRLHAHLININRTEGEFYSSIIEHCPDRLTSEEWFQILSRLPVRMLRSQLELENILSEEQRKALPPISG